MEVSREFLANVAKQQFDRQHTAVAWWKDMTEDERKAAYEAWLKANPDDYRSGWGYKMASISRNSMESVWEHHNETNKL